MALWLPLAVLLAGLFGGTTYAFMRARSLWRAVKTSGGRLTDELDRIATTADDIALQLDRADAASDRLTAASHRLGDAIERLSIQGAALDEARAAVVRALRLPS